MGMNKEMAIQQIKSAVKMQTVLSMMSLPIGYAVSYWFQPEYLQAKCSLWNYFLHFFDIVTTKVTAGTAIIVTLVVAVLLNILGEWQVSRVRVVVSAVLTEEEILAYIGKNKKLGEMLFGRIKKKDSNKKDSNEEGSL